jgi:bifunctional non-homologous end joining protein LigD
VWIGNAGSGIDQTTLKDLETALDGLRSKPPPGFEAEAPGEIDWLAPRLVVRVLYTGLTKESRLRHPVFVGFVDKRPEDCRSAISDQPSAISAPARRSPKMS